MREAPLHLPPSSPGELLARAIDVIEAASHRIFAGQGAVNFLSSADLTQLGDAERLDAQQAEDLDVRTRPEVAAVDFCMRSAISLLAVANSLIDPPQQMSPEEHERAWKKLGLHAKLAGRAAYQASLILCDTKAGIVRGTSLVEPLAGSTAPVRAASAAPSGEGDGPRIMIVEDDTVVSLLLQHTLARLGYRVAGLASSSAQAIELVRSVRPDLVLMDINLGPGGDGIETAQRILQERPVPLVYLTAYSEDATLERARATGAYAFLVKPFTERGLHATVQMALERHRSDSLLAESEQRLKQVLAVAPDGEPSDANATRPQALAS
ncbi:MAG: response regulator [Variovorax sp.]